MPKGFSEPEKVQIRAILLEKGKECFATYGVKRSNVEDLTRAAGISKGAFYLFYDSKEALFFELLVQFEDAYHATLLQIASEPAPSPRQQVQAFFHHAFALWKTNPLFQRFSQDKYAYVVRKLPAAQVQANMHKDVVFVNQLLAQWQEQGVIIDCDAQLFLGIMRALFFVSLHTDDFEQGTYPPLIAFLIDTLIQRLVAQ